MVKQYDPRHAWIGPASWPQAILKKLPYWSYLNRAGYWHDIAYGNPLTRQERLMADKTFVDMGLNIIKNSNKNILYKLGATVYLIFCYTMLRIFGMFFSIKK